MPFLIIRAMSSASGLPDGSPSGRELLGNMVKESASTLRVMNQGFELISGVWRWSGVP